MKKQLLNESEIRKMMKFADIGTLTDSFVEKLDESSIYETDLTEQEEPEDEGPAMAVDSPMGGDDDAAMDAAPGGDTEGVLDAVMTVLEALKKGLEEMGMSEAAAAIDVQATGEDLAGDMGGAPPEGEPADDAGDALAGMDMEMDDDEEDEGSAVVQEVVRRVTQRLQVLKEASSHRQDLEAELGRRVMNRLKRRQ